MRTFDIVMSEPLRYRALIVTIFDLFQPQGTRMPFFMENFKNQVRCKYHLPS
ncbi:hypothetical protein LCL95_01365 [Bacillus timonensis]|nr:hypothetical protein [Bacillus timonensis]